MLFDTIPIGGLFFALCTLACVVSVRSPRCLATAASLASCAPNQIPLVFLAVVVGTSLLPALAVRDLSPVGGPVGLALAAATTVGLVVVARRQTLARPAINAALAQSLGPRWRDAITPTLPGPRRRTSWLRALFLPWPVRSRTVERTADVAYGPHGDANRLDVYRHRDHPATAPTLIHLHGGRFRWGRKSREARSLLHHLASHGWTCISANYRLSPTPADGFPEHLVDTKRVIAWARAHAQAHGIDPATIVLSGSSAGAHLTAMAALTANDPQFQPGFEAADTSVIAAVGFYGYYGALGDDRAVPAPSSPLEHDAREGPPFLLIHGTNDSYTPVEGARALAAHLRAGSRHAVVLAELPGAQHAFDLFHSVGYDAVIDAVEAFAAWVRATDGRPSPHDGERRALHASKLGVQPIALAVLAVIALAACGEGDGTINLTTSTSSTAVTMPTTTLPSTPTDAPSGETAAPASPAEAAAAVARAWIVGDEDAIGAIAEPAVTDLLAHLDPPTGLTPTGHCEDAADETSCSFDAPVASLTLRVDTAEPSGLDAGRVSEALLTATGVAVALWPYPTIEEARTTKEQVDAGYSPWHLDERAVVLAYVVAVLGYDDPRIDDDASEGVTTRVTDSTDRAADVALHQPARTGEEGIWAVAAVQATTHSS